MYAANLATHFGPWTTQPAASYHSGQISQYTATTYIGSTYDEALPAAFLDDVYNATRPVIWIYDNIWELNFLGPVAEDSARWAQGRIDASVREFDKAGVAAARIFRTSSATFSRPRTRTRSSATASPRSTTTRSRAWTRSSRSSRA